MNERFKKALLPAAIVGGVGAAVLSGVQVEPANVAGVPAIEVNFDGLDQLSANPGDVAQQCRDLNGDGIKETVEQTIKVDQIDGRLGEGKMRSLARIAQNGRVIFESDANFKDVASNEKVANPVFTGQKPYAGIITFRTKAPEGEFDAITQVTNLDNGRTINGIKGVVTTGEQKLTCFEAPKQEQPTPNSNSTVEITPTPTPTGEQCVVAAPVLDSKTLGKRILTTLFNGEANGIISAEGDGLTDPNAARIQTIIRGKGVVPTVKTDPKNGIRVTRSGKGDFVITEDLKEDVTPGSKVNTRTIPFATLRGKKDQKVTVTTRVTVPATAIEGSKDETGCSSAVAGDSLQIKVPGRDLSTKQLVPETL